MLGTRRAKPIPVLEQQDEDEAKCLAEHLVAQTPRREFPARERPTERAILGVRNEPLPQDGQRLFDARAPRLAQDGPLLG